MVIHEKITTRKLIQQIKSKKITIAGNSQLKIYGTLSCASGKRMKKSNRVFFTSQKEATDLGFRPCAHCMKTNYSLWKESKKQVEVEKQKHQF